MIIVTKDLKYQMFSHFSLYHAHFGNEFKINFVNCTLDMINIDRKLIRSF